MGRRIQKMVAEWDSGTSSYASPSKTFGYIYDGWNLAVELENGVVSRRYVWGPDLSGSMQGAGGVGGLLAVMPAAGNPQMVFSDANGNVTKLADIKTQTVTAEYEYGPFGELFRETGPLAKENLFRFSTKYEDLESGLLYYGYRYYNPTVGRWISRDPIGENGGLNVYAFVNNNPVLLVDKLGLEEADLRGLTQRYCDAAATYPMNKWLGCACQVSFQIRNAMVVLALRFGNEATNNGRDTAFYRDQRDKFDWFKCTRNCMVKKWQVALKKWEGHPLTDREQANLTPAWERTCEECEGVKMNENKCYRWKLSRKGWILV